MLNIYTKALRGSATFALIGLSLQAVAQTGITRSKYTTVATSSGASYPAPKAPGAGPNISAAGNYTYTYGASSSYTDNARILKAFTAGGSAYTYNTGYATVIRIRRVENAAMTAYRTANSIPASVPTPTPRDLAYFEGQVNNVDATVQIKSSHIPAMENLFATNDLNIGIDNMFANTTATNFNNIERLDVINPGGISVPAPAQQGFALFERGSYNGHDPARVALITGLDINGDPISYAPVIVQVTSADYTFPGQTANTVYQPSSTAVGNFIVMRRDHGGDSLRASDLIGANQGIGGALIKFSDFGIPAGTTVYGYSVLANDFAGTGADAVDYTDAAFFPTNSAESTGAAGNDMATVTGVVKQMRISGNVFHDANGLTDNAINGTGIGTPSGVPLYVNLVNASNIVVGVALVQADGSFNLDQLDFGPLTLQLSINPGTAGSPAPAISLPAGWINTGEAYGLNNISGTGNEPVASANGQVAAEIGDVDITAVKFGIEQGPVADAKSFNVPESSFSGTPPPGYPSPAIGGQPTYSIRSNSTALTGYATNTLSGSDAEDCAAASACNTGKAFVINTINANTVLYYDFGGITGVQPVTAGTPITSFDPAKLVIYGQQGSGNGSPVGFTYSLQDAAGAVSSPAAYSINTASPLPVTLDAFNAVAEGPCRVAVSWSTGTEQSIRNFVIETSTDGTSFIATGSVPAENDPAHGSYRFIHSQQVSGTIYYRLKVEEVNGKSSNSQTISVVSSCNNGGVTLSPNPATSSVTVNGISEGTVINIISCTGLVSAKHRADRNNFRINVEMLPAGIYTVEIIDPSNTEILHRQLLKN